MVKPEAGTIFRIRTNVTLAGLLFAAGGGFCVLFFQFPAYRTELKFMAMILGGFSAIYSAYYIGLGLHERLRHEKISRALQFTTHYTSAEMSELRTLLALFYADEMTPTEVCERISEDQERLVAARSLLGLFEEIAIAVQEDHVDEKVILRFFDFAIPAIFAQLKPYIDRERELYRRQTFYEETEKLIASWTAGVYLSTGKVIGRKRDLPVRERE